MPTADVSKPRSTGGPVLSLLVVGVALAAVMVAATVQGRPTITSPRLPGTTMAPLIAQSAPPAADWDPVWNDQTDSSAAGMIGIVALIIMIVVTAAILTALVLVAVRAWRERRSPRMPGAAGAAYADAPPPAAVVRPAAVAGAEVALARMATLEDPSDAVIAAWLALEQVARDDGVVRSETETSTEFAVRLAGHGAGIRDDVMLLLSHYEAVRFGGEHADDHARDVVRAALERIRESAS